MWEIFLAFYLSSVGMLMYRLWWPIHYYMRKEHPHHLTTRYWPVIFLIFLVGLTFGAIFLVGCIFSDYLQERFCAKYIITLFEKET